MRTYMYPLLIIIAASSFGVVSTIIKLAMGSGFTAAEAVTSQFFVGFCIAMIIYLIKNGITFKLHHFKFSRAGIKFIILAGLFTGLANIVYGHSLNYLPASLAVVLLFQFTWIGMLISCLSKRQLPTRIEFISLIVLLVGTVPAAGMIDVDLSVIPFQGWLWGLAAAICYSFFLFVNGKATSGMSTSHRLVVVSFFAFIMTAIFQSPEIIWNGTLFSEGLWIYGLALGLFGMIIPVYLFTVAVPKVGLGMSSILSAIELPIAVIVSVLLLSEHVTTIQIIGIGFIIIGVSLPSLFDKRNSSSTQEEKTKKHHQEQVSIINNRLN